MRKDPTEFRKRFKKWQGGEKVYEAGLPKYEDGYESFLATLPDNQKKPGAYNTRRYWELNGKPKNFAEAIGQGMYTFENDNAWHANSVVYNDKNDTYEFMKPNYHPTRWMELVYGYDKDTEFLKDWKVLYNGPMLSDRYVRREKPGLKVKGGLLPKFEGGEEGTLNMGQKRHVTPSELKNVIDNMPVENGLSGYDPILGFFVGQRALSKMFSIGRLIFKANLRKSAQLEYKEARLNGHSPNMARIIASDRYVDSTARALDKMTRLLDFGM